MKRILIVEGCTIIRKLLIAHFSRLTYEVEEAPTRDQALKKATQSMFDLILIDTSQPIHNGLETLVDIKQETPETPVMIMSGTAQTEQYRNFILLGCNGYLLRNANLDEVLQAVTRILSGQPYFPQSLLLSIEENASDRYRMLLKRLSRREVQVFLKLATGTSTKAMSNQLHVSSSTVSVIKAQIMKKMNFRNEYELFQFALDAEMVPAVYARRSPPDRSPTQTF